MPTSPLIRSFVARAGRRLAVLAGLAGLGLCGPLPAFAHWDTAYWHEAAASGHNPQWMLTLGATKKLTELSLPGTHDSGTYSGWGGDSAQTQTMTIRQQLDSGVRYFDIRLKHYDLVAGRNCNSSYTSSNCALMIFHGSINMFRTFETHVLRPVVTYLRDNPSEVVLMRVAREDAECDCNPGPALNTLLGQAATLDSGAATGHAYSHYLLPSSCPDPHNLALGPVRPLNAGLDPASCDARGKILLLPEYMGRTLASGRHYRLYGDLTIVSPQYNETLWTNWDLYDRLWLPVKQHFAALRTPSDPTALSYTGIVGSGGGFPYFFASGHASPATGAARLSTGLVDGVSASASTYPDFPRVNCALGLCTIAFEGMNTLVADHLSSPAFRSTGHRIGIVSADFPGERFVTAVAGVNPGVSFNRPTFGYTMTKPNGQPYVPGTWTNSDVYITPSCSVACTGSLTAVTEDMPNGFDYTMTGYVTMFGAVISTPVVQLKASPVRVDRVPPTVTAAATTQPAPSGWYTHNVVVRSTCADSGGSGVASCPADQILVEEGTVFSAAGFAFDSAGNKSFASNVVTIRIDKTPPIIVYRGNAGSYRMGEKIDIRCEVSDRRSGVASSTCADIRGPAASFGPGTHQFSAYAVDVAGNAARVVTSFTVVAQP